MAIAFVVEGNMEQGIVQRLCPGVKVQKLGVNGESASAAVMAKFIDVQTRLLMNRYYPIVVLFDRERRTETCDQFLARVRDELVDRGVPLDQLCLGMADRCIESWIWPFLRGDGTISDGGIVRHEFDGSNGKARVKEVFRKLRRPYVETVDGVRMFCEIDPGALAVFSDSFRHIFELLQGECPWMAGEKAF